MWWLLWLILAVLLGVAEAFTLTLAFGILGGAALVTAVVAGVGAPFVMQVLAFAASSIAGLMIVRPIARRHALLPPISREGADALVGKRARVLTEVTGSRGLIHVAGEDWSARSLDDTLVIPEGAEVDVMEIQGATAIVYPRELLP